MSFAQKFKNYNTVIIWRVKKKCNKNVNSFFDISIQSILSPKKIY